MLKSESNKVILRDVIKIYDDVKEAIQCEPFNLQELLVEICVEKVYSQYVFIKIPSTSKNFVFSFLSNFLLSFVVEVMLRIVVQ